MTSSNKMRANAAAAVLAGLVLRVYLVLKFPVTDTGDAPFYIELAWNWLKNGVYGFPVYGRLTPVDMRVPGYPAFLAAVFAFAGQSTRAVMLAQVVVDLATCFMIALIAARLAPLASRRRVALAGLWLAALCPFTANYTAVVLTETLVIFLTALAILVLMQTDIGGSAISGSVVARQARGFFGNPWFLAGIVVGFGTLVRPETPLLLFAAGLVLVAKWWRPADWSKLLRANLLMALGLLIPLIPWAARNWRTLHDVQFLAPRYSELPGEYTPLGFSAWTDTWMWRFRDVYLTQWKVNEEEIEIDQLPAYAFDSQDEKERVVDLIDEYNEALTIDPQSRSGISRNRTGAHRAPPAAHLRESSAASHSHAMVRAAPGTAAFVRPSLAVARRVAGRSAGLSDYARADHCQRNLYRSGTRRVLARATASRVGAADSVLCDSYVVLREIRGYPGTTLRAGMLSGGHRAGGAGFCVTRIVFRKNLLPSGLPVLTKAGRPETPLCRARDSLFS